MIGNTFVERITCKQNKKYDEVDELEFLMKATALEEGPFVSGEAALVNNLSFGKRITEIVYKQKIKKG